MVSLKLTLLASAVLGTAHTLLANAGPTPIEKVLELLSSMRDEIKEEFEGEEAAYSKFSCFCQTTTLERSTSIESHSKKIHVLAAAIAVAVEKKDWLKNERRETKSKRENKMQEQASRQARCAKEHAQKNAEITDIANAKAGLRSALGAMEASSTRIGASAIQIESHPTSFHAIRANLAKTLMLAEVMSKPSATRRKAIALLQKEDPMAVADFHSGSTEIVDLLKTLMNEYEEKLIQLTKDLDESIHLCQQTGKDLLGQIDDLEVAIDDQERAIEETTTSIADLRESLLTRQKDLQDDKLYLTDLTLLCEERAKDWDQRSQAHAFELENLQKAIDILGNAPAGVLREGDELKGAALLQNARNPRSAKMLPDTTSKVVTMASKSLSFLQASEDSSSEVRSHKFLARSQLTLELRRDRALSTLRNAGQKLGSLALVTLALRAAGDPFKKVKGLIQNLIERLLEESKGEASKKGFCDTELGKAKKDRDFRWQESQKLSADLAKLEAKEEALTNEIKDLTKGLKAERDALTVTTADRELETKANSATITTAETGLKAVSEAIVILRQAYKQLAKGDSLLQEDASPVNENKVGPGFSGTYHGAQGRTKAVFALLEGIHDDFDRTMRTTTAAEEAAHRDFVDYTQAAKSSIGSKETQKSLDEQDLKTTEVGIVTKTSDLKTAVDLMDAALKELEALKPTCIDTGMSFDDRVKKRESEMAALQHALCLLDADAEADGSSCTSEQGAMEAALANE